MVKEVVRWETKDGSLFDTVEEAEKLLSESKSKKLDLEMKLKLLKQRLANRDY